MSHTDGVEFSTPPTSSPTSPHRSSSAFTRTSSIDPSPQLQNSTQQLIHRDHQLTVHFHNLSSTVQIPKQETSLPALYTPITSSIRSIAKCGRNKIPFHRIQNASGIIRPGTMTLVISEPGGGRSTLLRLLANRVRPDNDTTLLYNGYTPIGARKKDIDVDIRKMTQYLDATDVLIPQLTVNETLTFASKVNSVEHNDAKVTELINNFGLGECKDTLIGNALIRGISGGQKRRVSVVESLLTDASLLCLDQYSDGLDSATTLDITLAIKNWCNTTNGSLVATLQQPGPEIIELFDNFIILREGNIIYHGPRKNVSEHFKEMGFVQPREADLVDFIITILVSPELAYSQSQIEIARASGLTVNNVEAALGSKALKSQIDQLANSRQTKNTGTTSMIGLNNINGTNNTTNNNTNTVEPCLTTELMLQHYYQSSHYELLLEELKRVFPKGQFITPNKVSTTPFQHVTLTPTPQSKIKYSYKTTQQDKVGPLFQRELRILLRSKKLFIPRFANGFVMSLLYSFLYYQVPENDFYLRISALLIGLTQVALSNRVEVPVFFEQNQVVTKQISYNYYSSWSFVLASLIRSFPMCLIETIVFAFMLYFICGHALYATSFLIYFGILIAQSINLSVIFKFITSLSPTVEAAQSTAQTVINFSMVFGGFFISRTSILPAMIEFYWLSTFSWANRALTINEFTSPRYDTIVPFLNPRDGTITDQRIGTVYLLQADFYTSRWWILWGAVYLIGTTILFMIFHALLLGKNHYYESSRGTRRTKENTQLLHDAFIQQDKEEDSNENDTDVQYVSYPNQLQEPIQFNSNNTSQQLTERSSIIPQTIHEGGDDDHDEHPSPPSRMTKLSPPPPLSKEQRFEQMILQDTQLAMIRGFQRDGTLSVGQSQELQRQLRSQSTLPPPLPPSVIQQQQRQQQQQQSQQPLQPLQFPPTQPPQQPQQLTSLDSAVVRSTSNTSSSSSSSAVEVKNLDFSQEDQALPTLQTHLPFAPTWLSFENISYTVKVKDPKTKQTTDRVIIDGVSGYAQPGKLLALMGVSGAGKTTLLDVLSFRKTTGTVTGKILLNGQTPNKTQIAQVTCYVEQFHSLFAYETVYETLMFVATLRLPRTLTRDIRHQIVEEVLDILELTDIRDRLIGNRATPGLSDSQLKLVSIALELIANPSVLFLDEPTTGLNASSAMSVMRICKKIAQSGRSVICTLHQPSQIIFNLFDSLVLLGKGGHQLYFGDLTLNSANFIQYLTSCPFITQIKPYTNPASWLLNETSVFNSFIGQTVKYNDFYNFFPLHTYGHLLKTPTDPDPNETVVLSEALLTAVLKECFINSNYNNRLRQRLELLSSITLDIVVEDDNDDDGTNNTKKQQRLSVISHTNTNNSSTSSSNVQNNNDLRMSVIHPAIGQDPTLNHRPSTIGFEFNTSQRPVITTINENQSNDDGQPPPPPPPGQPPAINLIPNHPSHRKKRVSVFATLGPQTIGGNNDLLQERTNSSSLIRNNSNSTSSTVASNPNPTSARSTSDHHVTSTNNNFTSTNVTSTQISNNNTTKSIAIVTERVKTASLCTQFTTLFKRNHSGYWRNPKFLFIRLLTCAILSIIFGLIYLRPDTTTQAGVMSRLASVCVIIYFASTVHASSVPSFESRIVFYRERSSGYYRPILHAFVSFLNEALWAIPGSALTVIFIYFLMKLPLTATNFFLYYLTTYITVLCYSSTAIMLAAISPTQAACNIFNGAFLGLSFLFSGLTVTIPQAKIGWRWLFRMLPLSHGIELTLQLWKNNDNPVDILDRTTNQIVTTTVRDFISSYLGMPYDRFWYQVGWLCLYLAVTQIIAILATTFLVFQKR